MVVRNRLDLSKAGNKFPLLVRSMQRLLLPQFPAALPAVPRRLRKASLGATLPCIFKSVSSSKLYNTQPNYSKNNNLRANQVCRELCLKLLFLKEKTRNSPNESNPLVKY